MYCIASFLLSLITRVLQVFGLDQTYSVRDRATVVHRVLAYSETITFSTPASCIDTEIERGYQRRNHDVP